MWFGSHIKAKRFRASVRQNSKLNKVRAREGAIANTRGACAARRVACHEATTLQPPRRVGPRAVRRDNCSGNRAGTVHREKDLAQLIRGIEVAQRSTNSERTL